MSQRGCDGIYDILNYMTGDNLFTHQLPRAMEECAPSLLNQHPRLKDADASGVNKDNLKRWLSAQEERFGDYLPVEPLPQGKHMHINPIAEAEALIGDPNKVIVFKVGQKENHEISDNRTG